MNSGSWASYRAALPPECWGEPDDDPPSPKPDPNPTSYTVEVVPVPGEPPIVRRFDGGSFGTETLAFHAAKRWDAVMRRRYGDRHVTFRLTDER